MLVEIYIEALLVDEEAADRVWEAWHGGLIDDDQAMIAWLRLGANLGRWRETLHFH